MFMRMKKKKKKKKNITPWRKEIYNALLFNFYAKD